MGVFANDMTQKGLISKIHKQLIQLNIRTHTQPNQKMDRSPEQTFLQRRHIEGQQAHGKMLNITNHQRNANQNHNERSPILVRMAIIKKTTNSKCWRGCGEKGTLVHCWWECKLVQPLWKKVSRLLKKLKI